MREFICRIRLFLQPRSNNESLNHSPPQKAASISGSTLDLGTSRVQGQSTIFACGIKYNLSLQKNARFTKPYDKREQKNRAKCGTKATNRAKRRLTGIALFDASDSTCRFSTQDLVGSTREIAFELTKKFDIRVDS